MMIARSHANTLDIKVLHFRLKRAEGGPSGRERFKIVEWFSLPSYARHQQWGLWAPEVRQDGWNGIASNLDENFILRRLSKVDYPDRLLVLIKAT